MKRTEQFKQYIQNMEKSAELINVIIPIVQAYNGKLCGMAMEYEVNKVIHDDNIQFICFIKNYDLIALLHFKDSNMPINYKSINLINSNCCVRHDKQGMLLPFRYNAAEIIKRLEKRKKLLKENAELLHSEIDNLAVYVTNPRTQPPCTIMCFFDIKREGIKSCSEYFKQRTFKLKNVEDVIEFYPNKDSYYIGDDKLVGFTGEELKECMRNTPDEFIGEWLEVEEV